MVNSKFPLDLYSTFSINLEALAILYYKYKKQLQKIENEVGMEYEKVHKQE